eukprot:scaffold25040_cov153-Skeletonema_marinoi.AAC.2
MSPELQLDDNGNVFSTMGRACWWLIAEILSGVAVALLATDIFLQKVPRYVRSESGAKTSVRPAKSGQNSPLFPSSPFPAAIALNTATP